MRSTSKWKEAPFSARKHLPKTVRFTGHAVHAAYQRLPFISAKNGGVVEFLCTQYFNRQVAEVRRFGGHGELRVHCPKCALIGKIKADEWGEEYFYVLTVTTPLPYNPGSYREQKRCPNCNTATRLCHCAAAA